MSARDLLDMDAELGSENEDEDFDEETGEVTRRTNGTNGHVDDSSEEEEDDDDEEAERAIREGFIVDEDDEEEDDEARRRKRERKKRRREREEEEGLDEDDLDLIGEANPEFERREAPQSKFKRLKRGHKEDKAPRAARGVEEIFSDDEDDGGDGYSDRRGAVREPRGLQDEFADFIEEDEFEDEEGQQMMEDREVARPARKGIAGVAGIPAAGLDEAAMEDMTAAFGDGTEYDWALQLEEDLDQDERDPEKPLELKDVFEPSQLEEKMLTDEDNEIRFKDVPERFQLARKPFKEVELTDEEATARNKEEAQWISNLILPKKPFARDRQILEPFQTSIAKVLEFMNVEDFEVPFIFHHRKDYLIHVARAPITPDPMNPDAPDFEMKAEKLLNQSDLWEIFDLDLKFRALVEKRTALQRAYDGLKELQNIQDDVFESNLPSAATVEEIQDIQDFLNFEYSAQLRDVQVMEAERNGTQKRARAARSIYAKVRASKVYNMVRAFGITADAFAQNATMEVLDTLAHRTYPDDPTERPEDLADTLLEAPDYTTTEQVIRAAKALFSEEIALSPRMRKLMRRKYYEDGRFDCFRTERGLKKIDEDHPYYEFKYLRNQTFAVFVQRPELYLRMLKAEAEGLVEVRVRLKSDSDFSLNNLYKAIQSDGVSEAADAWNKMRREVVDMALRKLHDVIARGVKENLRAECENQLARACRDEYSKRLDQAPYKPKGMLLGTVPRVLALSNGQGTSKDAICWAWIEEDGRVLENGKFTDLRLGNPDKYLPDGKDVIAFVDLVQRRTPDVIAVSGWSVETRKLYKDLQDIVDKHDLQGGTFDDDDGVKTSDRLEVVIVNDEVARLYHTSDRAARDYPGLAPLSRYCVALARYMQNPLKEYAALGRDIVSINFDPNQNLLTQDKLLKFLETAMVDMVNLVGVDINEAVSDTKTANLLPYISGLGPRKAAQLLKVINLNGGQVMSREELVGDPENGKLPAVGAKVWANCASFLYIEYDPIEPDSDPLDNTRVHPEDYDLGRKMAADALELDEEDIKVEMDESGVGAVVRKLIKDDAQEKVNDLILEEYAEQLEQNFNQRKRATLETIRAELQSAYEELRRNFVVMSTDEIFTMLTGETRDSLTEGMIVPVSIKRTFPDHVECKLDCGVDGGISESEYPNGVGGSGMEPRQFFQPPQTVQAKLLFLNRKQFTAQLTMREGALRQPYRKEIDRLPGEWDDQQEATDKKMAQQQKDRDTGRAQRVIKHPLFRPFNATQAEEFLGSQSRGDVVIRPSSKGLDHLVVTWKVSDSIYQHIDVLELDKENEFALGKILKVGKHTYTDLDELIVLHVKAMAKKVDEMMTDEKYQNTSKSQTEQWLTTYTEANPRRSMYAFCINPKYPGYFDLCFKAGQSGPFSSWPVKVLPNAFGLQDNLYPDMRALKNGFKTLMVTGGTNGQQNRNTQGRR